MEFSPDDSLPISAIQHYVFCRRQFALLQSEGIWAENLRTAEGHILHERAHDANQTERRGALLITRGLEVFSRRLGVHGQCDVVEFRLDEEKGVPLRGYEGRWQPLPVEYKRGEPKIHDADRMQLALQAMCLEEMLCCSIPCGDLFYGLPRRREHVALTAELREAVMQTAQEMHELARRGSTPKAKHSAACKACSLVDQCLPKLEKTIPVGRYIEDRLREEEP